MKTFAKRDLPFLLFFALAVVLLLISSSNVARSAERFESDLYKAEVQASNIGITLLENGNPVSKRDNALTADKKDNTWDKTTGVVLSGLPSGSIGFGTHYPEKIAVRNSGDIPEYCRLIIRKYWKDASGKRQNLNPDLIHVGLSNSDKWVEDTSWKDAEKHPETMILYYKDVLQPGTDTPDATDYISIDYVAASKVTESKVESPAGSNHYIITTEYDYEGLTFGLEVEADAVQTHNAADALTSAWGYVPSGLTLSAD